VRLLPLVVALLAVPAAGCSWLLGVSEDPVVGDLGIDAAVPEASDEASDGEVEAAAEDAAVE
jgi:hypothetical protein